MNDTETRELINEAKTLLEERYNPPVHSVSAALKTASGEIFTAVNIDHFSAYVCAETAALSEAINRSEYEISMIVAVRKQSDGSITVANMCGKCRQIFHDYAPGVKIIVTDGDHQFVKSIDEILPFAFTRQREKIQSVIEGVKIK